MTDNQQLMQTQKVQRAFNQSTNFEETGIITKSFLNSTYTYNSNTPTATIQLDSRNGGGAQAQNPTKTSR